jgi:hypothetical protein
MTRTKLLAAAAAVCSTPLMIAAGATFRDAQHDAPQPAIESDFDGRWISIKKGDRLPLSARTRFALMDVQSANPSPVSAPPKQLPLATEDDIRQAEAEHHRHRHRDICPHGRTYFTKEHHQYWRCKL